MVTTSNEYKKGKIKCIDLHYYVVVNITTIHFHYQVVTILSSDVHFNSSDVHYSVFTVICRVLLPRSYGNKDHLSDQSDHFIIDNYILSLFLYLIAVRFIFFPVCFWCLVMPKLLYGHLAPKKKKQGPRQDLQEWLRD